MTVSVAVLFVLICFKEFLDGPIRRKLRLHFQLPIDLVVIIIATFIGSRLSWDEKYDIRIMGPIPVGLPAPKIPRTDFLFEIIYDALGMVY